MKTVCLDPGHGLGNANGSPDGLYKEHEGMWDIYLRMIPILEKLGIKVVTTRPQQSDYPSLTQRAATSNNANADAFVSLHSNAAGNGGWYSARGLVIYTSSEPLSAARNVLAADLVSRLRAVDGTVIRSDDGIAHGNYTVLTATNAPAVLIEYGFHTNEADTKLLKNPTYRQALAEATAYGVADFLGAESEEDMSEEQIRRIVRDEYERIKIEDAAKPVSDWAAEDIREFKELGITDGTRPRSALTREEGIALINRNEKARRDVDAENYNA